jgi:predicted nucleic-acid-binding protein
MIVTYKLVSQSQTVFVPGQNIMEGVVILHETIHEMHRKKMDGVINLILKKLMIR